MAFYGRKVFLLEKSGPTEPEPKAQTSKHSVPTSIVLSFGIVGAALLFFSYFALRRYASRRRSSLPPPPFVRSVGNNREDFADAVDHPVWHIRTMGLPQSAIDSIHRFSYRKGEAALIDGGDCSVCLSEFDDGDLLRLLPKCSHAFHVACIDTWLGSHTNCPLCRAPVLWQGGGDGSGSAEARESREEIENGAYGSGGSRNGGGNSDGEVIGGELERMRRCVSLDYSSSVMDNTEPNKQFWMVRSISLSGASLPV